MRYTLKILIDLTDKELTEDEMMDVCDIIADFFG